MLTPREIKRGSDETRVQNITEIVEREICPGSGREGRKGHNGINPRVAINSDTASVAVVRHVASHPYLRLREMR